MRNATAGKSAVALPENSALIIRQHSFYATASEIKSNPLMISKPSPSRHQNKK
jgi:hypothetical protein